MKRILATALLALATTAAWGQVCDQSFTLRTTACPAGALDCTNKGSSLTQAQLDANFVNVIDMCKPFDVSSTAVSVEGDWTFVGSLIAAATATPAIDFDDSDDAGTNPDGSINVNCPTANDCDMDFAVNSGADSETIMFRIDTTDAGASTFQVGNPGTAYVNVDEAGAMTFVSGDITLPALSVDAGTYAAASIDGDDINSNIAGTHLALTAASPDTLDVDPDLYTGSECAYIEDPATDEDFVSLHRAAVNMTITAIWCEAIAGTSVALDLAIDDGTPAAVNGSEISCTSTAAEDATLAGDTDYDDGDRMDLNIGTVTGAVTSLSVCWEYTVDDD